MEFQWLQIISTHLTFVRGTTNHFNFNFCTGCIAVWNDWIHLLCAESFNIRFIVYQNLWHASSISILRRKLSLVLYIHDVIHNMLRMTKPTVAYNKPANIHYYFRLFNAFKWVFFNFFCRLLASQPTYTQRLLVLLFGTFRVIASNSDRADTGMTSEAIGVSVAPSFFQSCVSDGKTARMEDVLRYKVNQLVFPALF